MPWLCFFVKLSRLVFVLHKKRWCYRWSCLSRKSYVAVYAYRAFVRGCKYLVVNLWLYTCFCVRLSVSLSVYTYTLCTHCLYASKILIRHCMLPLKLRVKTGIKLSIPTPNLRPRAASKDWKSPPSAFSLEDCREYEIAFISDHITANPQQHNLVLWMKKP